MLAWTFYTLNKVKIMVVLVKTKVTLRSIKIIQS